MVTFLFYWSWFIALCAIISAAISLSAYLLSRRLSYFLESMLLFAYFFDLAIVARTSYYMAGDRLHSYEYFYITNPLESIFWGAVLVALMWAIFFSIIEESLYKIIIPTFIFVTLSLLALNISNNQIREFCFFTVRSLMVLCLIIASTWRYVRTDSVIEKMRLKRNRAIYFIAFLYIILSVAWNIFFMFILPSISFSETDLGLLPERNFVENLFFVCWGLHSIRFAVRVLRVHFDMPPENANHLDDLFIAECIEHYSVTFGLSKREREVLEFIMKGKSNSQISSELFLSQSTVKVHVHNILSKTSLSSREELIKHFWHFI